MLRWDDACVAALLMADQVADMSYLEENSGMISPGPGTRSAWAKGDIVKVLDALGPVAHGTWTRAAETVLWRVKPAEWSLDFRLDNRFREAIDRAVTYMPGEVRAAIDEVIRAAGNEDARASMLYLVNELDWTFYERWRIDGGWLTDPERRLAIEIFHDDLAIEARRAIMRKLYPQFPFAGE